MTGRGTSIYGVPCAPDTSWNVDVGILFSASVQADKARIFSETLGLQVSHTHQSSNPNWLSER